MGHAATALTATLGVGSRSNTRRAGGSFKPKRDDYGHLTGG
jgi:hypothetical protein